jgi:hypothetical protein
MRDFVKQIEETIVYLLQNPSKEYYITLFPEGVYLREPSSVLSELEVQEHYGYVASWLWMLYEGYRKGYAPFVWRKAFWEDKDVFMWMLRLFFAIDRRRGRIYQALAKVQLNLHPDELLQLSKYIIKHKDEVVKLGDEEIQLAKLYYCLKLPNGEKITAIAVKKFDFDPMAILLHAYVYYVLRGISQFVASKKRKRRKKA